MNSTLHPYGEMSNTVTLNAALPDRRSETSADRRTRIPRLGQCSLGPVSGLNILTRTFTVQGRLFTYGLTTPIQVLNWLTGATPTVEVHAVLVNGQWQATEIKEVP